MALFSSIVRRVIVYFVPHRHRGVSRHLLALFLVFAATPTPGMAVLCPFGPRHMLTGTLGPFTDDQGRWMVGDLWPCKVSSLRGRWPQDCKPGKRFTATGRVAVSDDLQIELLVATIRCQ